MISKRKTLHTKEVVYFCQQLIRLLNQGMNLRVALLLLRDIGEDKWRERIENIVSYLDNGSSFGEALQNSGFPSLLTSFVRAGEQHNGLVQALTQCERYYRRKYEVSQKLMKALVYPGIVMTLMSVAFLTMQTTVLPRFATLYETMGIDLPWYTELLLQVNIAGFKGVIFVFIIVIAFALMGRKNVRSRLFQLSLRVPIIQETWQLRLTSVFSWQMGLLLQAGIPLIQSFELILGNWPWEQSKRAILRVRKRLIKGFSLHDSFSPEVGKGFHRLLPRQLAIGEASGMVAETLLHSGEMADERLAEHVQWLLRVWEPLLILIIGIILAAMVLALFLPMLSLVEGL